MCGPSNGNTYCPSDLCCSSSGWCGTTPDHCADNPNTTFSGPNAKVDRGMRTSLNAGEILTNTDNVIYAASKQPTDQKWYAAILQDDGNFVIYKMAGTKLSKLDTIPENAVAASSNIEGFQSPGSNIVAALTAANSPKPTDFSLKLESNGRLVIFKKGAPDPIKVLYAGGAQGTYSLKFGSGNLSNRLELHSPDPQNPIPWTSDTMAKREPPADCDPDCIKKINDWIDSTIDKLKATLTARSPPPPLTQVTYELDLQSHTKNCCSPTDKKRGSLLYKGVYFKVNNKWQDRQEQVRKVHEFLERYAYHTTPNDVNDRLYLVGMWHVRFDNTSNKTHPFSAVPTYVKDIKNTKDAIYNALQLGSKVYDPSQLVSFYTDDTFPLENRRTSMIGDLNEWTGSVPVGIYTVSTPTGLSDISALSVPSSLVVLGIHAKTDITPNVRIYANSTGNAREEHHLSQFTRQVAGTQTWRCFGDKWAEFDDKLAYALVFEYKDPKFTTEDNNGFFVATTNICSAGCDCDANVFIDQSMLSV